MHTKHTTGFVTNLNAVRPAVIFSLTASKLCVELFAQVLKPSKGVLITGQHQLQQAHHGHAIC